MSCFRYIDFILYSGILFTYIWIIKLEREICFLGSGFPTSYVVICLFNDLRWETIVCFIDIGEIVDHHCINFLYITHDTRFNLLKFNWCYTFEVHVKVWVMLIIEECTKCEIQKKIKALFLYFKKSLKIPKG